MKRISRKDGRVLRSYGLALSGGGTRGAAHAGVLLALKEEELLPSAVAGTSAGSVAAGCFASGMEPEELCEMVRKMSSRGLGLLDVDYIGILRFLPQMLLHRKVNLEGLLKGERLRTFLEKLTQEKMISQTEIPLLIPAVDLKKGNTVCFTNGLIPPKGELEEEKNIWMGEGKLSDIITASSSVPGIFAPRHMGDFLLVDGGVTNNLPSDLLKKCGIRKVVAVDVGSVYEMSESHSVLEILTHSFSVMGRSLKDCRSEEERLLLWPDLPKEAGLLTFDCMEACMEAAYKNTKEEAERIRQYLSSENDDF